MAYFLRNTDFQQLPREKLEDLAIRYATALQFAETRLQMEDQTKENILKTIVSFTGGVEGGSDLTIESLSNK